MTVKAQLSGELINVWVMASSAQFKDTEGLCGYYDGNKEGDLRLRNGSTFTVTTPENPEDRPQPDPFILDWR